MIDAKPGQNRRPEPSPSNGRPVKITFGEMREMGVQGVLVYCADYRCGHSVALSADRWAADIRLSDLEPRFVCNACGQRGADVRPDFDSGKFPVASMGYRNTT